MEWPDPRFPADPYPGTVPPGSYAHLDGVSHPLAGVDLDAWLHARGAPPAAARVPVLTYGSNRCPSKITWLRQVLGLGADPVVVLRVRTTGVAAVWASGLRWRDSQRPAVLAAADGVTEDHALWLATPGQIAVLDRCEGRDTRFRLARLRTGTVTVLDETNPERSPLGGARIDSPWCYLGHAAIRRPLLVDGHAVRCTDVPQAVARHLDGEPAPSDGLHADTVTGNPHPDEWPAVLFTYGLLQPGQRSWDLVAPHAAGPVRPARLPGAVFDTGRGYPAWLPGTSGSTPGTVVPLRDPAALLPALDAYEGAGYRRIRAVVPADGTVCWAYAWRGPTAGLTPLAAGRPWASRPAGYRHPV